MLDVKATENVVSRFIGLLKQSEEARKVIESWGLSVDATVMEAEKVGSVVVDLLAEGVEVL